MASVYKRALLASKQPVDLKLSSDSEDDEPLPHKLPDPRRLERPTVVVRPYFNNMLNAVVNCAKLCVSSIREVTIKTDRDYDCNMCDVRLVAIVNSNYKHLLPTCHDNIMWCCNVMECVKYRHGLLYEHGMYSVTVDLRDINGEFPPADRRYVDKWWDVIYLDDAPFEMEMAPIQGPPRYMIMDSDATDPDLFPSPQISDADIEIIEDSN